MRACAAGVCLGAQVYLFGAGVGMPIARNGEWIAALWLVPLSALAAARCSRALSRPRRDGRLLFALLALTLLGSAAFAAASLVSLIGQTLLPQTRPLRIALLTLPAILACALPGGAGVGRACFALRWALGAGLLVLAGCTLEMEAPSGLFPLLGAGPGAIALTLAAMLGALAPALLLILPPPELVSRGEAFAPPGAGFFARRAAAGAAVGAALLFLCGAYVPHHADLGPSAWGARLRIAAGARPREGLLQTGIVLLEAAALVLAAGCLLAGAAQALSRACQKAESGHAGLLLLGLLLSAALLALPAIGFSAALAAAPFLAIPAALVLLLCGRMGAGMG